MQATRKEFIIALDEGTTNAKAVVLDSRGSRGEILSAAGDPNAA